MTFKFETIRVDQGTTAELEHGDQVLEDKMDLLKDMICKPDVLTAQISVTTLTPHGVQHHEIAVDNENAQVFSTALKARGDIVESSELYRQITTNCATATMIDGDSLTVWLGAIPDERTLHLKADSLTEAMDCTLIKF